MRGIIPVIFMVLFIGCNLVTEKGSAIFQDDDFEIKYSFKRDLTGFLDFPTKRWLKVKNKKTGKTKEHRYHVDIVGNAKIHIFLDSLYETNKGKNLNVISFRDFEGSLDLNVNTMLKVNEEYLLNKYFGKIKKIATIQNDTFSIFGDNRILNRNPMGEFEVCFGPGRREGEIFKELDIVSKEQLGSKVYGVIIRNKETLKVLILNNNRIEFQNISMWTNSSNLEIREHQSIYDIICNREIDRIKYEVTKIVDKTYNPRRHLIKKEKLVAEFLNEIFLLGRVNLVDDERLKNKNPIEISELLSSKNLRIVKKEERK